MTFNLSSFRTHQFYVKDDGRPSMVVMVHREMCGSHILRHRTNNRRSTTSMTSHPCALDQLEFGVDVLNFEKVSNKFFASIASACAACSMLRRFCESNVVSAYF